MIVKRKLAWIAWRVLEATSTAAAAGIGWALDRLEPILSDCEPDPAEGCAYSVWTPDGADPEVACAVLDRLAATS